MIITRKIEVYVCCDDKEQQKEMRHTIYEWRDWVRRAANAIISHKTVMQNVRDFVYFTEKIQDKFYVKDTLVQGPGCSEQNTTYKIASKMLKGKVPSDIYSCLNQAVCKTFKETVGDYIKGQSSMRTYKNNIPIPFSAKAIGNIHKADDERYYFTLFGIPFACRLGADRSNNAAVIDRCVDGDYSISGSSLQIDDRRKKMFLLLVVDMPQTEVKLKAGKTLFARLDVDVPIVASTDIKAKQAYDSGMRKFEIGNKEEYLHRRLQIQAAVRRCQINNKYSTGGHGRKEKCKAIDHWHEKEKNYITTRVHTYSRLLVDMAIKNKCDTILLLDQTKREEKAKDENQKGEPFLLRNWSYYGLKEKIKYKAAKVGIKVEQE